MPGAPTSSILALASTYGRRDALRRLGLIGLGGAVAAGYGALATDALMRGDLFPKAQTGPAPITHQLGWLKGVQFGGVFMAQEKGYFKDAGVDAVFTAGGPSTDYRTLVCSGRMLVSESSPLAMIQGAVQGQPIVAFAAVMQQDPAAFMSPPDRPVASLQDMLGKTIGVPPSVRKLITVLLKRAHIDPGAIKFVPSGTDPGMLVSRQIDAYYSYATTAVPGLRSLGMDPHVLFMSDLGLPSYAQAYFVRRDTLDRQHARLVRYTRALVKGWRYFIDNPDESAELIVRKWAPKGSSLSDQVAQAHMMRRFILAGDAKTHGLLWIDPDVFKRALVFAREGGVVPPAVDIDVAALCTQSVIKEALGVA
jgi:NitT/TauT family transport system substrate-binding protein